MPLFLLSWFFKLRALASSLLSLAVKHWKITIALILILSNVYAFSKINKLKVKVELNKVEIQLLNTTIQVANDSIDTQNAAIAEGEAAYNKLVEKKISAEERVSELNDSLTIALNAIAGESIGEQCQDKIQYLRDSTGDLTW